MRILRATKITLLVMSLMLSASAALAGEFSAVLNGRSIHLGSSEEWNENNVGLGIEYEFASESRWRTRLLANGFQDSTENMSYMAGGGLHRNLFATDRLRGFYVDAGVSAFLMTRDDVDEGRPFPGVLPTITFGNRYVGMNLTYLPKQAVEKFTDARMQDQSTRGILFLQVKFNLNP
jgi:hypothetical protein